MPWCDPCSLYRAHTVLEDGTCPDCGEEVDLDENPPAEEENHNVGQSAPWHFWVVVALLVMYIGWRVIDLILRLF